MILALFLYITFAIYKKNMYFSVHLNALYTQWLNVC